jgi:hypothetical protein
MLPVGALGSQPTFRDAWSGAGSAVQPTPRLIPHGWAKARCSMPRSCPAPWCAIRISWGIAVLEPSPWFGFF